MKVKSSSEIFSARTSVSAARTRLAIRTLHLGMTPTTVFVGYTEMNDSHKHMRLYIREGMASSTSTSSPPKLKVTFKKWTAVAVWKWITPNDETECGICRLPFEGCCPDCKFPGDDCALGGCGLRVQFPVCLVSTLGS